MKRLQQYYRRTVIAVTAGLLWPALFECAIAEELPKPYLETGTVKVGNVASVTSEWRATLTQQQRNFYEALLYAPGIEWNDGLPFDRLVGLFESRELDCMVAETFRIRPGVAFSENSILFEMVIFGRRGDNLLAKNTLTVGYPATLPQFEMPFSQPIEWYGLKTLKQGGELLKIGRIDAMVAHSGLFDGDRAIDRMPFPPVHAVELNLQCHDTPRARAFLSTFDARLDRERDDGIRTEGSSSFEVSMRPLTTDIVMNEL
ncbi:MAG: hypothetical protein KTR23_02690 [Rhodospirillales bacterium]|nr:hypothetical protein [Rhodospirillales bacterium]